MQASSRVQKLHPPSWPSSPQSHTHHFPWALVPSVELVRLPKHSLCDFCDDYLSSWPRSLSSWPQTMDTADLTMSYMGRGQRPPEAAL